MELDGWPRQDLTLQAAKVWLRRIPEAQPGRPKQARYVWRILLALQQGNLPPDGAVDWLRGRVRLGRASERLYAKRILQEFGYIR